MTPDRQALERAARAYLAAYDVESSNSEMWYRAVVDARDALRAALARETPTPPTPAEGRGEEAVVTAAIRDVLAERAKQRRKWGDSHDDDHKHGELTIAAAELAVAGTDARVDNAADGPDPWGLVRKNPNRRDQLVIAAALLLAEIERKDRAIRSLPPGDGGGRDKRAGGEA